MLNQVTKGGIKLAVDLDKILMQIEELRRESHIISEQKELTDPEVVIASQMLDAALNEYYRLLKRKTQDNV